MTNIMAGQVEVIDTIPVELTAEQEELWAQGKKGQAKVRKQVKKTRKQWLKDNMLGDDAELAPDYDETFGGDDK